MNLLIDSTMENICLALYIYVFSVKMLSSKNKSVVTFFSFNTIHAYFLHLNRPLSRLICMKYYKSYQKKKKQRLIFSFTPYYIKQQV